MIRDGWCYTGFTPRISWIPESEFNALPVMQGEHIYVSSPHTRARFYHETLGIWMMAEISIPRMAATWTRIIVVKGT